MIQLSSRLLWRTTAVLLAVAFVALVAALSFGSGGNQGSAREAVQPPTPNAPPQTPPPPTPTVDALSVKPPTLSPADVTRAAALPTATEAPPRVENGVIVLTNTNNTLEGGHTYSVAGLKITVPPGTTLKTAATTAGFFIEETATGAQLWFTSTGISRRVPDTPAAAAINALFDQIVASRTATP